MTLIVGIIHDGKAWLAADSCGSDGFGYDLYAQPKLFSNGKLKIGYTSSFRMGQLLEHDLSLSQRGEDQSLMNWLISGAVSDIRRCLKNGGFATYDSGEERGGAFLLVAENRIFAVNSDYSVLERATGYDALGSGQYPALGALHATRDMNLSPLRRLRLALEAGQGNVVGVKEPWWVMRPGDSAPVRLEDAEWEEQP